jgi:hypothetical protein
LANSADLKLATISVVLTLHPEDCERVFNIGLHLHKKRSRETAQRQLARLRETDLA